MYSILVRDSDSLQVLLQLLLLSLLLLLLLPSLYSFLYEVVVWTCNY